MLLLAAFAPNSVHATTGLLSAPTVMLGRREEVSVLLTPPFSALPTI